MLEQSPFLHFTSKNFKKMYNNGGPIWRPVLSLKIAVYVKFPPIFLSASLNDFPTYASPHKLGMFGLREISKIQLHILPNWDIQMHKINSVFEFKDGI